MQINLLFYYCVTFLDDLQCHRAIDQVDNDFKSSLCVLNLLKPDK